MYVLQYIIQITLRVPSSNTPHPGLDHTRSGMDPPRKIEIVSLRGKTVFDRQYTHSQPFCPRENGRGSTAASAVLYNKTMGVVRCFV